MVDEAWDVAPFAGAWIEILLHLIYSISYYVAPFAGAWIEIGTLLNYESAQKGRSLRGSVD